MKSGTNDTLRPTPLHSYLWFFEALMRYGFCIYILFLPMGKAPANIGSISAMIGLLGYYGLNYQNSNLHLLGKLKWVYFLFLAYLVFKIFDNINISNGWYGFRTNIHGAFTLFLVGLEFVRNQRDIRTLVILFTIAGFYEGLDGVYQYLTGFDFIRGDPPLGGPTGTRLTGSFKTFRVGNYMSMVLPISLGAWFVLPKKWPVYVKIFCMAATLAPGLFLLAGSQTRSGFIGLFVALTVSLIIFRGINWKVCIAGAALVTWALFFGFERTSFAMILKDGRLLELWPYAWQVFLNDPIFGVGLNSYNPGVHALGLEFKIHTQSIPHPHNIYLQFLCEMGIVGLGVFLALIITYLRHSLRAMVNKPWKQASCEQRQSVFFWAAFAGYLASAASGHSFFRPWWLGTAFSIFGIVMGCGLTLSRSQDPPRTPPRSSERSEPVSPFAQGT